MAESNVILCGPLKYRDGKKWKPRLCLLKKLSPVADNLHLSLFKDRYDYLRHHDEEKHKIPLEKFMGLDSSSSLDKESHVMTVVCQSGVVVVAFDTRDVLTQWELAIRNHLGHEHQFPVHLIKVPPACSTPLGLCKLYIQGELLCLTAGAVPHILASWHIADLRRFGLIDGHFCFEAASSSGAYVMESSQGEEITRVLQQAAQDKNARTKTPTRLSQSLGGSLASIAQCRPPQSDVVYVDLALVSEEEGEEQAKPHPTDDRGTFSDIYNLIKVEGCGESSPRRYSCGDVTAPHDAPQCMDSTNLLHPQMANSPPTWIRRPSYPQPLGATMTQVHTDSTQAFTSLHTSPKLHRCDTTENQGYVTESPRLSETDSQRRVGKENCVPRVPPRASKCVAEQSVGYRPVDDGYLYWDSQMTSKPPPAGHRHNHSDPIHSRAAYMNLSPCGPDTSRPSPGERASQRPAISLHGSLKRTHTTSQRPEQDPYGTYVRLRCDEPLSRSRGRSLEDVLESDSSRAVKPGVTRGPSTHRTATGSQTRLPGSHSLSQRTSCVSQTKQNTSRTNGSTTSQPGADISQVLVPSGRRCAVSDEPDYLPMGPSHCQDSRDAPYLDMSIIKGAACPPTASPKVNRARSMSCAHSADRPPLLHSRSLDNELDSPTNDPDDYLDMSRGIVAPPSHAKLRYVKSSSSLTSHSPPLPKPFDNLLPNRLHSLQRKSSRGKTKSSHNKPASSGAGSASAGSGSASSGSGSASSGSSTGSSSPATVKRRPSLLSRLIRRNSKPSTAAPDQSASSSRRNSLELLPDAPPPPSQPPSQPPPQPQLQPHSQPPKLSTNNGSSMQSTSKPVRSRPQTPNSLPLNPTTLPTFHHSPPRRRHDDVQRSTLVVQLSDQDRGSRDSLPSEPAPVPPPVCTMRPITVAPHSVPPPPSYDRPALPPRKVQYVNTDPGPEDLVWAGRQAPALPEKTYQHRGSVSALSQASSRPDLVDDVFYMNEEQTKECIPQRRGQPSLTVNIPHPAGTHPPPDAIPVIVAEDDEIWPQGDGCRQSQASLTSCVTADTAVQDDQRTSPALTTLRPRSGREYQRLDRRKIAPELDDVPPPSQPPSANRIAQSPTSINTFNFDFGTYHCRKSVSSVWSSGEESPKHSLAWRPPREPIYMNINLARNESLAILEGTPPSSPGPRSLSRFSESQLNYAEIDLTENTPSRRRRPPVTPTEYAMIDMVATAAASRVGREHARLREDILLRKESLRLGEGRPTINRDKKGTLSRHSSITSRDR